MKLLKLTDNDQSRNSENISSEVKKGKFIKFSTMIFEKFHNKAMCN